MIFLSSLLRVNNVWAFAQIVYVNDLTVTFRMWKNYLKACLAAKKLKIIKSYGNTLNNRFLAVLQEFWKEKL